MSRHPRFRVVLAGAIIAAATAGVWNAGLFRTAESAPETDLSNSGKPSHKDKHMVSMAARSELLARAHVWRKPTVPIARAVFDDLSADEVSCRFKVSDLGGTTPKFDCVLEDGEEIRIKYGNGPEIPAETAATRLLSALGFGADRITLVKTLRCQGCPDEPFSMMKAVELTHAQPVFEHVVDYNEVEEFEWVALERKFEARPVETDKLEGWSFFELDAVDERKGGAPRAHIDAIRLMAVLLAHWDNKSENQRLVCLQRDWKDGAPCPRPFLLLQDVGATFGPTKMDLDAWEKTPIWEDRAQCTVSMRGLPFEGATFGRAVVTDAGRRFLGELLSQLSVDQLTDLFSAARFDEKRTVFTTIHEVPKWVAAFRAKVRAITDGPPCPMS